MSEKYQHAPGGPGKRFAAGVLVLLIAAAAVLRGIGLNQGLWFDEITALVLFVRPSLERIVTEYSSSNNHPLYSVLAHIAVAAFGEHPWTLRLPALLFGVASVPAVYALGRSVTGRRESLLAAALITVSYHHIWFSQNARGYTALAVCAMAATWLLLQGWRSGRAAYFMGYGVVAALGVYTHLTMVFVVIAHAMVVAAAALAARGRERGVPLAAATAGFALATLGAMLLYAPMAAQVYAFFSGPPPEAASVATPTWALREALRGLQIGMGAIGVLAAGVLVTAGLWSYWVQDRFATALFVMPGAATAVAAVVLQSPIRPRFFFFLVGFAVLLVVRGSTVAGRLSARVLGEPSRWREVSLASALVGLMMVASLVSLPYGYRYPKQDYEGAMRFVDGSAQAGADVLTAGLAVYPYREYYGRPWRAVATAEDLNRATASGRPIVVVYTFPEYEDANLMRAIRERCKTVRVFAATVAGGDIVVCTIVPVEGVKGPVT